MLKKNVKFCKYNSLIYFEKSDYFLSKYIVKLSNLSICGQKLRDKARDIIISNKVYINEINSGAILLLDESLKAGKLIQSNNYGYTIPIFIPHLEINEELEKYQII